MSAVLELTEWQELGYASEATFSMHKLTLDRTDIMKARASIGNRAAGEEWDAKLLREDSVAFQVLDDLAKVEDTKLNKALRKHELWSWLSQYTGLGGVQTARVVSGIQNPHRFPGQQCTAERPHYVAPVYSVNDPCPRLVWKDNEQIPCSGLMLSPRENTGVRSLWHYLGLSVNEAGESPHRTKKVQSDWQPELRAAILMPNVGMASMIVRNNTPKYREIYDLEKARLLERGPLSDKQRKKDNPKEMRDGWADATAKKIAVKTFLGDMLVTWKGLVALEN